MSPTHYLNVENQCFSGDSPLITVGLNHKSWNRLPLLEAIVRKFLFNDNCFDCDSNSALRLTPRLTSSYFLLYFERISVPKLSTSIQTHIFTRIQCEDVLIFKPWLSSTHKNPLNEPLIAFVNIQTLIQSPYSI